jgi:hypothetical protein
MSVVELTPTPCIVEFDRWTVKDTILSIEKMQLIWHMLCRHQTLFTDLTRNDEMNFVHSITSHNSLWFDVFEHEVLVGIVWFGDMQELTNCTGHMVFFDTRPAEKVRLLQLLVKWMFANFPLHRISVTPPVIYWALIRLLERVGFAREGLKHESVLMRGKWMDQAMYRILRTEVEAIP